MPIAPASWALDRATSAPRREAGKGPSITKGRLVLKWSLGRRAGGQARRREPACDPAEERARLTRLFTDLGAKGPEGWARSQVDEGIGQLHRFAFLHQAWKLVLRPDDTRWIQAVQASDDADEAAALRRLMAQGADPEDLITIVRAAQAELLFGLCYLLDDPGDLPTELAEVGWRLVEADPGGRADAARPIIGLHESVLEMDPAR